MPEPEPKPEPNADFNATLVFDGTTKSGHVIRVELTDSYGMKDWLDSESRLTIFAEAGSTAKTSLGMKSSISIAPKSSTINCIVRK